MVPLPVSICEQQRHHPKGGREVTHQVGVRATQKQRHQVSETRVPSLSPDGQVKGEDQQYDLGSPTSTREDIPVGHQEEILVVGQFQL